MKYFDEIYELQRELNIIIGRDTVDDKTKIKWGFDYFVALMSEAQELLNCTNWKWWTKEGKKSQYFNIVDLKNAKIEAIDCLHFLMSLIQIFDVDKDVILNEYYSISNDKSLSDYCLDIINYCNLSLKVMNSNSSYLDPLTLTNETEILKSLKNVLNLNYEAKADIKKNINKIFKCLMYIFSILNMENKDILRIYELKHEKNILRQQNNYSVLTKTEDDNNEIKEQI